ncbi:Trk system potassium transporter TrkA [Zoogloeaceae bacteirum Par-f-2]|uniref:Trk system potassium transporter TrkA n=1 Tax=Pseudothauera hydrothermalis TaxID=2184083 RepID=UPI000C79A566|nr:Trk system potassium transporter TrkA [Pseudothauera hydrothermalis]AUM01320.1 Trk system potassium transport protein TrkA [Rhodocyclaceae bacterium]AVZ80476.1 Trk system potassium transporter TrkA [Zoogloeaceae bacteirum Par-f-2]
MKIIILGAGQVGASVAENLVSEANDITLVDTSAEQLAALRDRLEVRTVCGNAASPSVLREAGADDADLLIAVTQSDQTNLCACRIAKAIFNLPTRIARLRSTDFVDYPELLDENNFAVDFSICPEQIVTDYIRRLIAFPEALQVLDFADGVVSLIGVKAFEGGPLVGHPLKNLRFHLPNVEVRIAAIYRNGEPIIPEGDTVIVPGDEVFCLAATVHIRQVMRELRRSDKPMRRLMIAGGGNIGFRLARSIESDYHVKILEVDKHRAETLATQLSSALVLRGDATDEKLLENEGIDETDLFVALTNDEEDNIMAASLAKRMGARRTLALINRKSYVDLVQGGPIDIAISPAHTSIGSLLAHVRRGDVVAVHSLRRGAAEALEIIAHGTPKDSKVVGRQIEEIALPKGATIGAIVRDERRIDGKVLRRMVIIPHHDTVIEPGDHVIVFCTHKNLVRKVEKLFQVGFTFL